MARKETGRDGISIMRDQIRNGIPASCILLYGEEVFLVERFLKEIRDAVLTPDARIFNEVILEGKVSPERIVDACETYPAFAERKLVIVRKSGLFKAAAPKKNGTGSKAENEIDTLKSAAVDRKFDWKPFFASFPVHALLLFVEEEVNRSLGLYKLVDKHGLALEMPIQTAGVLNRWVQKGFSQYGKRILPHIADYLIYLAEEGMTSLHQEIGKVSFFMGDRVDVSREDILAVVIPSIHSRVFDLMDAVAAGERTKAFQMLDDMLRKREPEQKIFYMMTRQGGRLLQLKRLGQGLSQDRKAELLGMNAYACSKMERLAGKLDEAELARFIHGCVEADLAAKRGEIKLRLAMELLISGLGQS